MDYTNNHNTFPASNLSFQDAAPIPVTRMHPGIENGYVGEGGGRRVYQQQQQPIINNPLLLTDNVHSLQPHQQHQQHQQLPIQHNFYENYVAFVEQRVERKQYEQLARRELEQRHVVEFEQFERKFAKRKFVFERVEHFFERVEHFSWELEHVDEQQQRRIEWELELEKHERQRVELVVKFKREREQLEREQQKIEWELEQRQQQKIEREHERRRQIEQWEQLFVEFEQRVKFGERFVGPQLTSLGMPGNCAQMMPTKGLADQNKFNSINIGGGSNSQQQLPQFGFQSNIPSIDSNDEFIIEKLQEILSPSLPPISQDSKGTKGKLNNGIINENKAIIDKPKDNWLEWLNEAIQNEHINFYKYSSFKNIQKIGSGGFGKVYKAIYNNSSTFALKSYKHDITYMKEIINELKLLRKVDYHPNIIHFYGVTKNERNEKYLLVLEYADSETLRNYLKENFESISWDLKLKFAYEIASAVSCLHENDIIHQDLHSNNFLIHQKTIKLVDFGLSCKILESTTASAFQLAGMLPYIDPQCFKHKQVYKPNKKSDVYSVGVLLWEVTSNRPPFSNPENHRGPALLLDIFQGIREEPIPNTPDEYINLYKACWRDDPESRPDIQCVETILNGMVLSTNIVNKVDKEENDKKQKNKDISSYSHPNTILTESTTIDSLQAKFDKVLDF